MYTKEESEDTSGCRRDEIYSLIGSDTYSEKDVIYEWLYNDNMSDSIDISEDIRLSQYALISWWGEKWTKKSERIGDRTVLSVTFELKRDLGNFLIQTYLPCSMVVILSWISFFLNREATPARVALGIMTILSITTLGWNSRTQLPKVHYANAIDWYVLLCFGFTFAAVVEFASVNYFTKRRAGMMPGMQDDEEDDMLQAQVEQVDAALKKRKKGRRGTFSLFRGVSRNRAGLSNRLLNSTPNKTRADEGPSSDEDDTNFCGAIIHCLSGNAAYRRKRFKRTTKDGKTFNSVSKIDEMSRIIFPVTFCLANALFWCIYYIF